MRCVLVTNAWHYRSQALIETLLGAGIVASYLESGPPIRVFALAGSERHEELLRFRRELFAKRVLAKGDYRNTVFPVLPPYETVEEFAKAAQKRRRDPLDAAIINCVATTFDGCVREISSAVKSVDPIIADPETTSSGLTGVIGAMMDSQIGSSVCHYVKFRGAPVLQSVHFAKEKSGSVRAAHRLVKAFKWIPDDWFSD